MRVKMASPNDGIVSDDFNNASAPPPYRLTFSSYYVTAYSNVNDSDKRVNLVYDRKIKLHLTMIP